MPTVRIYEMTVRSFLPLPGHEALGEDPDIDLIRSPDHAPRPFEPDLDSRIYVNPDLDNGSPPQVEFHRQGRWNCLRYPEYVDFYFSGPGPVLCFLRPGATPEILQTVILGPLCAVLLELRGTICLHANAVTVGGVAVGLAGRSGAGKSTLAAMLVDQGCALLTDDVLPLRIYANRCLAVPGYPQLRLSRGALCGVEAAANEHAMGALDDKARVAVGQGWGAFAASPATLRVVYVLDCDAATPGSVTIEPLPPQRGFVELLRFGFCARLVGSLGLSAARFRALAEASSRSAVRRLRFPHNLNLLPDVQRAISDDLAGLGPK